MRFMLKYHDGSKVTQKEVEAISREDALRKASLMGTPIAVKKINTFSMGGLSFSDRQIFFTRLSAMLASGVGVGDALNLIVSTFSGRIKKVASTLLEKVEAGSDLPQAIEELGQPDFPETSVALIKAGSRGGSTHEAIREANHFERNMVAIKKGSSKGLIGAFITFLLAIVANVVSIFYMMPAIMESDMMGSSAGQSVNIDWVMTLTDVIGVVMAVVMVIVIFLGLLGTVGRKLMPSLADKIIMKIPVYKELMLAQKNYISFFGMSLLVNVGVRMDSALSLTHDITPPGALKDDFKRAREAVMSGRPWAPAMKTIHDTDRAALGASLDNTQIAAALKAIAEQYADLYAQRISTFVPLMKGIGSVCIVIAGVIMFGVTILPMMQLMKGML